MSSLKVPCKTLKSEVLNVTGNRNQARKDGSLVGLWAEPFGVKLE